MKKDYRKPSLKKFPVNLSKSMLAASDPKPNNVQGNGVQLVGRQDNIIDDEEEF